MFQVQGVSWRWVRNRIFLYFGIGLLVVGLMAIKDDSVTEKFIYPLRQLRPWLGALASFCAVSAWFWESRTVGITWSYTRFFAATYILTATIGVCVLVYFVRLPYEEGFMALDGILIGSVIGILRVIRRLTAE